MIAKTFRNTLVASSLLVGTSLLIGSAALAEEISGDVPIYREAVLSPTEIVIDTDDAIAATFGTLFIRDNSAAGWKLTVTSANGGLLENGTHGIAYTGLTTDDVNGVQANALTLAEGVAGTLFATQSYSNAVSTGVTVDLTADIAVDARKGVPSGVYTDTLTFTMSAQ